MFRYIGTLAARFWGWCRNCATRALGSAPTVALPARPAEAPEGSTPNQSGRFLTHQPGPMAFATGTQLAAAWRYSDAALSPQVEAQGYICRYVQPVPETGAVYVITVLLDGRLEVRGRFPTELNLQRAAMSN